MHVQPHDETKSIIQTVKGFFGLPERDGVGFEDSEGTTLIPRYDNFTNVARNDAVHIRVVQKPPPGSDGFTVPNSPRQPQLNSPFEMQPPFSNSRSASRNAKRESVSPTRGGLKHASSGRTSSRTGQSFGKSSDRQADYDGFSGSETGSTSVTSSRKENLASAEISVDNIVEGNRRKRAKFESSVRWYHATLREEWKLTMLP